MVSGLLFDSRFTLIAVPFAPALAEGEEVARCRRAQDVVDRTASAAV